ncbi:hypothetical protein SK571_30630 [Lentzea sp. BCCO 10_0798]|uniref:Uncharacterized protein n=1 Tax=Lentzea kristufekii TaxID=3095430 RepID=A0ABU4U151_9PSEU|nr:hypothetical protein [Lentzea sp. BCCO 10_0798]MDX8053746.1 hypothetical protein [Lentzea sp. BCCO 10_0798]
MTPTFEAADGMHGAIVRATKPADSMDIPVVAQGEASCCGVSACCTPTEQAVEPGVTVIEAKSAAGCGCQ